MENINSNEYNTYEQVSLELSLAQIKYLTPTTLLLFVGSSIVSATFCSPTLAEISDEYLTILTPIGGMIGAYWMVILVLWIGQCILLNTSNVETKKALAYGIGKNLALINICMSFWTLFWTMKYFLLAEIALLLAGFFGLLTLVNLSQYPARNMKEFVFIHTPMKMLFVIVFTCDIWQNGLMGIGWYRYVGPIIDIPHGHWEADHVLHTWIATGLVLIVSLVNSYIVYTTYDIIWASSAIYLGIALALKSEFKPIQVFVALIVGAGLVFISFVAALNSKVLEAKRERDRIAASDAESERRALLD